MKLEGRPDADLVMLALGGETAAYGELVRRYKGAVHGLAYSVVSGWSEAEDLAQEAFLRAYLNLGQLREPARFAPWLRRLTVRLCLDFVQAHAPARLPLLGDIDDLDAGEVPMSDPAPGPSKMVEHRQLLEILLAELDRLPARYRVPLVMFYLDGATYEGIASVLGKPVGTVKSLVHRARDVLRSSFERQVADPLDSLERDFETRRLNEEFAMRTAAIIDAARAGDLEAARKLLDADRSLVDATGEYEKTALHWAAQNNHAELARLLVATGADLAKKTAWGATALEWAVNLASTDVAELLLSKDPGGLTLWIAAGLGKTDAVAGILRDDPSPPGRSRREGDAAKDYAPDSALMQGDSLSDALYIACRNGHTRTGELLLDRGAHIDAKGYFGATGLHWAAINGHAETVEMLIARGADLARRDDKFHATAAGWATEGKHTALAMRLIDAGAPVAIWEAANYGHAGKVRAMLTANPTIVDARGEWGTALHEAAFFGHVEVAKLLLASGADPDVRTCDGDTALQIAERRGHAEVADLIREAHPSAIGASDLRDQYRRQYAWRAWSRIYDQLGDLTGKVVLDLGCGPGDQAADLAARGARIIGVDCDASLLAAARERNLPEARFVMGSMTDRSLLSSLEVDGIWISFAAAYVAELDVALDVWAGCLRPGGWLSITEVDDLLGHEPLPPEHERLVEAYYDAARDAGRYQFRTRSRVLELLRRRNWDIAIDTRLPDAELSFDGPAAPGVIDAWATRFARMGGLAAHMGEHWAGFRQSFLDALASPAHRSRAKVWTILARSPAVSSPRRPSRRLRTG